METLVQSLLQLKTDIETKEKELSALYDKRDEVQRILDQAVPVATAPKGSRKKHTRSHTGLMGAVWSYIQTEKAFISSQQLSDNLAASPNQIAAVLSKLFRKHPVSMERKRQGHAFLYRYVGAR